MLTDIKESYDNRVAELKALGAGTTEIATVKDGQIASLQELNETLKNEVEVLK